MSDAIRKSSNLKLGARYNGNLAEEKSKVQMLELKEAVINLSWLWLYAPCQIAILTTELARGEMTTRTNPIFSRVP